MNPKRLSISQRRQQGLTMVELMVSITIGMLIVAAMSVLFANNSRTRVETERAGIKIDNGRYAIETLARDLQHAGHLGELDTRSITTLPAAKPGACESGIPALDAALLVPVVGYDNVTTAMLGSAALSCLGDVVAGTDIVVVRRAATCANGSADCTALANNAPAFQASSCNDTAELGGIVQANYYRLQAFPGTSLTLRQRDCATRAPIRRYLLRIYYVAQNDQGSDGIPTLKRRELGATGWGTATTLVQGVENLQVEWGVDTDADGIPDLYATDPDKYCATAAAIVPSGTCWTLPVAAKLSVLARNLDRSPGHSDTKVYALGKTGDALTGITTSTDATVGAFNDGFKRNVFQRTVALQNVTGRRFAP